MESQVLLASIGESELEGPREVNRFDERVRRNEPFLRVNRIEERDVQTVLVQIGKEFARIGLAVYE